MSGLVNLTGKQFKRLKVIRRAENRPANRVRWLCECICGNHIEVKSDALRSGNTGSCGCLRNEGPPPFLEKEDKEVYSVWFGMKVRCQNPRNKDYKHYGARGIKICDEWRESIKAFVRDMGARPPGASLDRIDNNGPYAPWNCKWSTQLQQNNNKRNNRTILYDGRKMTITQAAREAGLKWQTVYKRVEANWAQDQLFRPVRRKINVQPPA